MTGKVFVVDNGRVSSTQKRSVLDALELVEEGYSAGADQGNAGSSQREKHDLHRCGDAGILKTRRTESARRVQHWEACTEHPAGSSKFSTGMLETYKKCHGFPSGKKRDD